MTNPLTVKVDLYELDHVAARFRSAADPSNAITGIGRHALIGIDLPVREWMSLGRPGTVTLTIQAGDAPASAHDVGNCRSCYISGTPATHGTWTNYRVGDPTPPYADRSGPVEACNANQHRAAETLGYICDRPRYHMGEHIASVDGRVVAIWTDLPDLAPHYKVGDPDPTPDIFEPDARYCMAQDPDSAAHCTWPTEHHGAHVAGNGTIIVATWGS